MSKWVIPSQEASRRRSRAVRIAAPFGLIATAARAVLRAMSQRDQALDDLGAARSLLRRKAWLEHVLREVAAAAASGEVSEHDLAQMAASRLRDLLNTTTAGIGAPTRRGSRSLATPARRPRSPADVG